MLDLTRVFGTDSRLGSLTGAFSAILTGYRSVRLGSMSDECLS